MLPSLPRCTYLMSQSTCRKTLSCLTGNDDIQNSLILINIHKILNVVICEWMKMAHACTFLCNLAAKFGSKTGVSKMWTRNISTHSQQKVVRPQGTYHAHF